MTHQPDETSQVPLDAAHARMPDYLLIFANAEVPPKEHAFSAMSDEHAVSLMKKKYAGHDWTLYRVERGQHLWVHRNPKEAACEPPTEAD